MQADLKIYDFFGGYNKEGCHARQPSLFKTNC
jgi:hypothetical protein